MRLAVVDLLFCWPPRGGAHRDLFETLCVLAGSHETALFRPYSGEQPPGMDSLPFPAYPLPCAQWNAETILKELLPRLEAFRPDVVLMGDGWMMKARVASRLCECYPTVLRMFAYEMLCPRNNMLWQHTHACGFPQHHDWGACLDCAKSYRDIIWNLRGHHNPLTHDMEAAKIWNGTYEEDVRRSILLSRSVIVNNTMLASFIAQRYEKTCEVVPGGVDLTPYRSVTPFCAPRPGQTVHIFSHGRLDDTSKGADDLVAACRLLRETGMDLRLTMTRKEQCGEDWIREIGWINQDELIGHLSKAHVVVTPSRCQEPFGLTWLEALAAQRPLVATRVAGPLDHIEDGVHALLVEPGDPQGLAQAMTRLARQKELAEPLVAHGKRKAEELSCSRMTARTARILEIAVHGLQEA